MTYTLTDDNHDEVVDKVLLEIAGFVKKVEEFGYMVETPYWDKNILGLELVPSSANRFLPTVRIAAFCREKYGTKYCTFEIETTSFGCLYLQVYKEFLKACEQAAKLVEYLETVDFSTFPTVI